MNHWWHIGHEPFLSLSMADAYKRERHIVEPGIILWESHMLSSLEGMGVRGLHQASKNKIAECINAEV